MRRREEQRLEVAFWATEDEEGLLALDPAEVGAVTEGLAGADVGQRLLAVEGVRARAELEWELRVVDRLVGADLDAVERVDHRP